MGPNNCTREVWPSPSNCPVFDLLGKLSFNLMWMKSTKCWYYEVVIAMSLSLKSNERRLNVSKNVLESKYVLICQTELYVVKTLLQFSDLTKYILKIGWTFFHLHIVQSAPLSFLSYGPCQHVISRTATVGYPLHIPNIPFFNKT